MNRVRNNKNKIKYMNEFPIIILVVTIAIVIILFTMYLNIKPYEKINKNGYMVLANNMTYNLIHRNNNQKPEELEVGVANVTNGDYVYKQLDTYYVGVEKKKEVEYEYPIYSSDGLTIYNQNEDVTLIDRNFEKLKGYRGLSLNYGILYNDGDVEPADIIDYLFLYLNNSVYINTQTMVIKTLTNEYSIPIHSPIYFDNEYVNYYAFDGKNFKYNSIGDVYYDSLIKIGDVTLSYYDFLIQMGLVKPSEPNQDESNKEPEKEEIIDGEIEKIPFVKPTVYVEKFKSNVYSINSNLTITDPSGVIETKPVFEIYTMDDELYLRKKFDVSNKINISGLSSNTKYKIVGTFSYKNESNILITSTFYEDVITTKDVTSLDELSIKSELGDRYSNKIQFKKISIENFATEAAMGIKNIIINIKKENTNETKNVNVSYSQINELVKGKEIKLTSSNDLESDTGYVYEIKIYDKDNNELKITGSTSGSVKTAKQKPNIKIESDIDTKNNEISIDIKNENPDDVYIKDYKYYLYSQSGYEVSSGMLEYKDAEVKELFFDNLDYNTNYILKITGVYDLEDGQGRRELDIENDFTTVSLKQKITAWYDKKNVEVTKTSIKANVYISSSTYVLEKPTTEVIIYLADKDGNDILDDNGKPKYYKKYTKSDYSLLNSYEFKDVVFEGLKSGTEYQLKIKINVNQLEKKETIYSELTPTLMTEQEDAYIVVTNKKLLGNALDLKFEIQDPDMLIEDKNIIVEIYRGDVSRNNITERYIYRRAHDISKTNKISIYLENYIEEVYTIFVSTSSYNGVNVKKYLNVKTENEGYVDSIKVSEQIDAKLEMYQQRYTDNTKQILDTQISFKLDMNETTENVYFIDCVDNECENLGYIDPNGKFISLNDKTENQELKTNPDDYTKNILSIINKKTTNSNDRTIYIALEKNGMDLTEYRYREFKNSFVNLNLYVLKNISYNTDYEIFNINDAKDFYDSKVINGSARHYVVTKNLDFKTDTGYLIKGYGPYWTFSGVIDFQGYSVELYYNSESRFNYFGDISKKGAFRNAVFNYHFNGIDVVNSSPVGFVYTNHGILENIIVNIYQDNESALYPGFGSLCYDNYGTINNFVVYLNDDLHMYKLASLVTYLNHGIISNGYVSTNPQLTDTKKIIIHDTSSGNGTFASTNTGTVKNVYNLVSAVSNENLNLSYGIGTIVRDNAASARVLNTISVATTTQNANKKGPNIYLNYGSVSNNYYVDTNGSNGSYSSKYNKKIGVSTLINTSFWEFVINKDDGAFEINLGYYPTVKMSSFMEGKQGKISIEYDYFSETKIDILSSETIKDNTDNGVAQVKVFVSNPNKYEISGITVEGLSAKINSIIYDEQLQSSIVTLDLELEKTDVAKSTYMITALNYVDKLGGHHSKIYDENNLRSLDVDIYRRINEYKNFVESINKNENIYLVGNLQLGTEKIVLPNENIEYTAIIDGNEKTIDFNNKEIQRGYFINNFKGVLKNIQIKNLSLTSQTNTRYGFINSASTAMIENVDLDSVQINRFQSKQSGNTTYIGALIASASSVNINKVSVNNLIITRKEGGIKTISNNYIGGIVGHASESSIYNSYVYNMNINKIYRESILGNESMGGIIGVSSNTSVVNCYTQGTIETDYNIVGGIVGNANGTIKNNYSYVKIIGKGNYVSGVAGIRQGGTISNNMFIGILINKNDNPSYALVTTYTGATNSYALVNDDNNWFDKEKIIEVNTDNLTEFDIDNSYDAELKKLPYLNQSSFVEQKIKNDDFTILMESNVKYSVSYQGEPTLAQSAQLAFTEGKVSNFESSELIIEGSGSVYNIKPKDTYKDYYSVSLNLNGEEIQTEIKAPFYRTISSQDDWNKISEEENENIYLTQDVTLNKNVKTSKKIASFLGNDNSVIFEKNNEDDVLNTVLIKDITKKMENVTFKGFSFKSSKNELGLIHTNKGRVNNCKFEEIKIDTSGDYVAIIVFGYGKMKNIELVDISVSGKNRVASLVSYNSLAVKTSDHISFVTAKDIKLYGETYVGGIAAMVPYYLSDIKVEDLEINRKNNMYPKKHIAGIVASGNCTSNCQITNSKIYASGSYISGIQNGTIAVPIENAVVINLVISDYFGENFSRVKSNYVSGISTYWVTYRNSLVDNLTIGTRKKDGTIYPFYGDSVSGLGFAYGRSDGDNYVRNNKIKNSIITGENNVSALLSDSGMNSSIYDVYFFAKNNVVYDTVVIGTGDVGGIRSKLPNVSSTINSDVSDNMVISSTITGKNVGGIVGKIDNRVSSLQSLKFSGNLVLNTTINSISEDESGYAGGLIGWLEQVPKSQTKLIKDSIFYGIVNNTNGCKDCSLIGRINKLNTGGTGYGENTTKNKFIKDSNLFEYTETPTTDYQINSYSKLLSLINMDAYKEILADIKYFPVLKSERIEGEPLVNEEEYIQIPFDSDTGVSQSKLMSTRRMFRNYSNSYSNPIDVDYDVYTSGVNTVNIEFSDIDSNLYFYYEIGNYKSELIPLTKRTYTITYDFVNPIKLYVSNGFNYKNSEIKPNEIARTISLINDETYYIQDGLLYSESKAITGKFVNIYNDEALTTDSKIYNVISKKEFDTSITYNLLEQEKPIYETIYAGNDIKTYYNYSTVNGVEREMQLFVKNGVLSSVTNSLDNKKNMYIIDYYNNNEIQMVLDNNGKLYSLIGNIKYPTEFINKDISELYTNFNSSNNIVVLKYSNGRVNSINYRTGELVFTNVSNDNMTLLEYIKSKITNSSKNNTIESIASKENYNEMSTLKTKLMEVSLDEAGDKIYNTNNSVTGKENYLAVYNQITEKYDIYKESEILNTSLELESETNKIYKDYELIKFYKNIGQGKTKKSVKGIVVFGISIISVLIALAILIKHKVGKKGGAV